MGAFVHYANHYLLNKATQQKKSILKRSLASILCIEANDEMDD